MELTINTERKTITVIGEIGLLDLFQQLTELGIDFTQYKLAQQVQYTSFLGAPWIQPYYTGTTPDTINCDTIQSIH